MGRKAKDVVAGKADVAGVDFTHNIGIPNGSSSYGKALFVCGRHGVEDRFYPDGEIARMCGTVEAVQYAGADGRLLPASRIGEDAAIELFMNGAAEIEDPVVNRDEARTLAAVSPVMAVLLGTPNTPGVVDFRSAGRLWALTGYAIDRDYLFERDPVVDGRRLYEAAVASEKASGPPLSFPALVAA